MLSQAFNRLADVWPPQECGDKYRLAAHTTWGLVIPCAACAGDVAAGFSVLAPPDCSRDWVPIGASASKSRLGLGLNIDVLYKSKKKISGNITLTLLLTPEVKG